MANGSGLLPRLDAGRAHGWRTSADDPSGPDNPGHDMVSRHIRRNRYLALMILLALIAAGLWLGLGPGHVTTATPPHHHAPRPLPAAHKANPRPDPDLEGDGQPVTMAFGGDVNFPSGSTLGDRLADHPATALGAGVPSLLSGVNLSMVNLETALTDGTCPDPQPKSFDFFAPVSAITAR